MALTTTFTTGQSVVFNSGATLTLASGATLGLFGTNVTAKTGTGAIVLATSPTLTTPVISGGAGEIMRWTYSGDATKYTAVLIDTFGQLTFDQEPGFSTRFSSGGVTTVSIGAAGLAVTGNTSVSIGNGTTSSTVPNLGIADSSAKALGLVHTATDTIGIIAGDVVTFKSSATLLTALVPLATKSYTVATLPSVSPAGQCVYVSDAATAPCLAFSNGSNWKRCDNAATTVV